MMSQNTSALLWVSQYLFCLFGFFFTFFNNVLLYIVNNLTSDLMILKLRNVKRKLKCSPRFQIEILQTLNKTVLEPKRKYIFFKTCNTIISKPFFVIHMAYHRNDLFFVLKIVE